MSVDVDAVEGGGHPLRAAAQGYWYGSGSPHFADVPDDGLKLRAERRGKIRKEKNEEEAKACKIQVVGQAPSRP